MPIKFLIQLAGFGILGGLLMFFGDLCFYLRPISGADFIDNALMNTVPSNRLIIGGVVGPLAGLLYALGSVMYYLAFREHNRLFARMVTSLFVVMFVVGGTYHTIYATYGFVGNGDIYNTAGNISALIGALQRLSFVAGLSGSLLFIYMVLKYDTIFPKWIVLFTPTFWTLLIGPIAPFIPYPAGAVIIGGWINICFILFFALCAFVFAREGKRIDKLEILMQEQS